MEAWERKRKGDGGVLKAESKSREKTDFGYEENIGGSLDERLGMSRNPTG